MEAIIAIAMLCNTATSHAKQVCCQKWFTACYEKKVSPLESEPKGWKGPLKECVKERPVKLCQE